MLFASAYAENDIPFRKPWCLISPDGIKVLTEYTRNTVLSPDEIAVKLFMLPEAVLKELARLQDLEFVTVRPSDSVNGIQLTAISRKGELFLEHYRHLGKYSVTPPQREIIETACKGFTGSGSDMANRLSMPRADYLKHLKSIIEQKLAVLKNDLTPDGYSVTPTPAGVDYINRILMLEGRKPIQ